jgi:hypothetical protein
MPPKKANKRGAPSPLSDGSPTYPPILSLAATMTGNAQLHAKLDFLCEKIQKVDDISEKIDALESTIQKLAAENVELRKQVEAKDKIIDQLNEKVNKLDQAARSTSLRILGLSVTSLTPAAEIPAIVFKEILLPCFEAAKQSGDVPPDSRISMMYAISNCFSIPAKKGSTSCPVIVKLNTDFIRGLVFKHKKTALPTMADPSSNRMRPVFSIFEDLSPSNYQHFRTIVEDYRVKTAWSYSGQIRFKLHTGETVYKVTSLSDSVETITKAKVSSAAVDT